MSVYVVNNYLANATNISWDGGDPHSNVLQSSDPLEFTGYTIVNSAGGNKRNVTFDSPEITMKSEISIRNDDNNSITYRDALVNFDDATWNANLTWVGRMFFTGTSSLSITPSSIGKTLIKASTLSGEISLTVSEGVNEGDTFSVRSTDNQLVITGGDWTATPSTVGNITTYTLAKAAPVYKTRLIYEHLTDIPLNFTEVEYLESSGTQYIDTGYEMSNDNMTFDGNIMWTDKNATANFFFGYRLVNSPVVTGDMRAFFVYGASASPIGRLAIRYGVNADNSTQTISLNTKYNISWDGSNLKINGTTYDTLSQAYTPASYKSMFLFWCNCENTYSADVGKFIGRIYNWQIKQDGVLVRDFVPCLDNNNVPCMYDKVTGQAYYNAGTGSFTHGRKIIPVDYLESTGTQYIDLGITSKSSMRAKAKFSLANVSAQAVFGSATVSATGVGVFFGTASTGVVYCNRTDTPISPSLTLVANTNYEFDISLTTVSINGVDYTAPTTSDNNYNMLLFARTLAGNVERNISGKIYYFKLYDNGVLVRDFISCKDENNVGFMFDRVTHTAYLNAGTGSFTVGKVMPKKKLRLIMDSKRRLPKGFKEVEYLESTGTQYIDTGFKVDDTCGYDVKWMALNADDRIIMGTKGSGDSRWVLSGSNNPYVNLSWNTSLGSAGLGLNKIQTARMNYLNDRKRILNDTPIADITATLSSAASTYNVGIFGGYWGATTISLYSTCRIYYAKITKGTEVIRDFIPCLDNNNTPCMYDLVGKKAYYNAGTGSFTYGHTITPVEYLESTGAQCIDTGVNAKSTLKTDIYFEVVDKTQGGHIFGGRTVTSGGRGYGVYLPVTGGIWFDYETRLTSNVPTTNGYRYRVVKDGASNTLYVNGVQSYTGSNTAATFDLNVNMALFYMKDINTSFNASVKCKVFYFKIWDSGVLVRDFIPVKDENNVGYMLDKVSHTLYSNAGTGDFVVGGEYKDIVRFLKGE